MYEEQFGLTCNPFRIPATGSRVFVGPQQARVVSSLQNALSGTDNVVTVSGPAGVGKTALVTRALETNKAHHMVAWVGRMRLAPDDVLTLLLSGFGLAQVPSGAMQRFAVFRQILNKRAEQGIQVVVVVEDALRLGNDALLELEAITASDGVNSGGGNIVLMGPPEIEKRLNFPELARLKQRARNGRRVEPFTFAEVQGYLTHCLRSAGGDFGKLFDDGAAAMVYRCSEGIPRIINNICESAMIAAAQAGSGALTAQLIRDVAENEYGIQPVLAEPKPVPQQAVNIMADKPAVPAQSVVGQAAANADTDLPAVVAAALAQEEAEQPAAVSKAANESWGGRTNPSSAPGDSNEDDDEFPGDLLIADTGMNVAPQFQPDPNFDIPSSQLVREETDDADDLPMLSNSMRVDIQAEIAKAPAEESIEATAASDEDDDDLPDIDAIVAELDIEETATHKTLNPNAFIESEATPEMRPEPETVGAAAKQADEIVAPEESVKKPATVVDQSQRLIPDLDALEAAISAARRGATDEPEQAKPAPTEVSATPETTVEVSILPSPEPVIAARVLSATNHVEDTGFSIDDFEEPVPEPRGEPENDASDTRPSLQITLDRTLEDQRKEGLKLDALAAELASVETLEDISDKMAETLFGIEFEQIAADAIANPPASGYLPGEDVPQDDVVAKPALAVDTPVDSPANDSMNDFSPLVGVDDLELDLPDPDDMFEEPRLDSDSPGETAEPESMPVAEEVVLQELPERPKNTSTPAPDSIEDQFETGMTQTLKALNTHAKDDVEKENSRGLLGKLKKTLGR